ncbi:MAG: GNAT family N-acetyltransferase, partial [Gemmatimonadales bacterium]
MVIRPVHTLDEYRACVDLQEEVWGKGFSQRVPTAILQVSQRLGGIVSGAWNSEGVLVGFVFGMTGWEAGRPVHWSDMLAVHPEHRNGGLGRRLKLHQRDELLRLGVTRMYWTFDPLESRNAHLNLARLGATAGEYVRDMYGTSSSPLHRGIGTDRFVAVWEMDSPRVRRRLGAPVDGGEPPAARGGVEEVVGVDEGGVVGGADVLDEADGIAGAGPVLDGIPRAGGQIAGGLPQPGDMVLGRDDRFLTVTIPASIQDVLRRDPELALRWRARTRAALEHYLGRGWVAVGLHREGDLSRYVLARDP